MSELVKKTKEHEIDLKVYKYKWKKELENSEPDKKLIKNQIDSFIFMIENSNSFHDKTYLDEMTLFSKIVLSYGHLAKLDNEYKEKFKKVNQFIKKEWDGRSGIYLL